MKIYVAQGTRRANHRAKRGASPYIPFFLYKGPMELVMIQSSPHIGYRTPKNCEPHLRYRLWDLQEQWCKPSYIPFSLYEGPGTQKNEEPSGAWKTLLAPLGASAYIKALGLEEFRALPIQAPGLKRAKRGVSHRILLPCYIKSLGLGEILSFRTWKNSERSLEARLERHETCSSFFSLANKSQF